MIENLGSILNENIIEEINKKNNSIRYRIENKGVILLGSGNLGKKILNFFIDLKINVWCIVDNNPKKQGQKLGEIDILSPIDANKRFGEYDCPWVVTIWSPGHDFALTKSKLNEIGIIDVVSINNIFQIYSKSLLPYYHFETPEYYLENFELLEKAYSKLFDDESRQQFIGHLKARIGDSFDVIPYAQTDNQYFPQDIVKLERNEIFLDCGAYTGDTLSDFLKYSNHLHEKFICLEPDPINFSALTNTIKEKNINNVEVYSIAVGNQNAELNFEATGGGGAGLSKSGTLKVSCKRIDDFFNEKFTFIKLDIEGAELDALKGADNTILSNKPKIAVCIYHLPSDLWSIILYLSERYPFYTFSARTHQYDGLDFVLYAIPTK
jgi:FkbM family methyltransferase